MLSLLALFLGSAVGLPCHSEHRVTVRDGVELTTFVIVPEPCNQKWPAVIDRTPYGPTVDEFAQAWLPFGYASVMQNQRGCFTSGGEYDFWKQDGNDAYDTMLWIRNQTWSNGDIFTVGISADAISAYADFIIENPFIKGGYEMWGSAYGHETSYWGGAYREDLISHWLLTLNTCPNAVNIELEVRQNEAYDEWWADLEANGPYGNHFVNVDCPGVTQAAWWDIFAQPQLNSWAGALQYGQQPDKMWLFVIPLGHCTGNNDQFLYPKFEILAPQGLAYAVFAGNYSAEVFKRIDKYNFYVFGPVPSYIGANETYVGNYWTSLPDWPAITPTKYYLGSNGQLTTTAPVSSGSMNYTYDPNNPSPSYGGNNLFSSSHCGPLDQSQKVESRNDILKWTSAPLTSMIAMVGQITATIQVQSTAVDTDFMVALTDVYPDGLSSLTRYGAVRMKWYKDPTTPNLITPGQTYNITVDMWSTAYIWQPGHSIRVTITSSNSPQFSTNPNNGKPLVDTSGPLIIANNTVLWSPAAPSFITLPIVDLKSIPENPYLY